MQTLAVELVRDGARTRYTHAERVSNANESSWSERPRLRRLSRHPGPRERGPGEMSGAPYAALRRRDDEAQLQVPHVQRIALQSPQTEKSTEP
jgi:hypothetical protein